jgi:hypothetical protein
MDLLAEERKKRQNWREDESRLRREGFVGGGGQPYYVVGRQLMHGDQENMLLAALGTIGPVGVLEWRVHDEVCKTSSLRGTTTHYECSHPGAGG